MDEAIPQVEYAIPADYIVFAIPNKLIQYLIILFSLAFSIYDPTNKQYGWQNILFCHPATLFLYALKQFSHFTAFNRPHAQCHRIVKEFMLTDGYGSIFEETDQEAADKKTVKGLKDTIAKEIPDAEVMLFGDRAKGSYHKQSDWDMLILTAKNHPKTLKWELQEKLLAVTLQHGARVNLLLAQKTNWYTDKEYESIRKRIEGELVVVS